MFAVSQFTTMPQSPEKDLQLYEKAGVEAIEVCETKYPESARERRELVARLKDSPMQVTSIQTKVHAIFPDRMAPEPKDPRQRLESFKRAVGFWSDALEVPDLPFVLIAGVAPNEDLRNGWRESRRWIKEAAAFVDSCGARLAFETLGPPMMYRDSFVYGLDQGVRMMEAAESAVAGLVIDVWHVWEEHDLERRLMELAERVWVVHACDWPEAGPRGLDDRVLPGEGQVPLRDLIFGPLRAGGYEGPFTVEVLSDLELEGSLWAMEPEQLLGRARQLMAEY